MADYVLSQEADRDIEQIAIDSAHRWGWDQAERYVKALHAIFEMLVRFPDLGRSIDHLRAGYRRFEHARHSVFYKKTPKGLLIVRILHSRMLPDRYL